jgi:hypothetical protein
VQQLETKQTMYVFRNIEVRSCEVYCSGKAVSVTNTECVFVELGTAHSMRLRHFVFCLLPHYVINSAFSRKKILNKIFFLNFSADFV